MTAKEFLQRFFILHREVENNLEQIARLQSLAMRATSVLKGVATGSKASTSCVENSIVAIHEKTAQLAYKIAYMVEVRNEIAETILNVKNPDERCLLELRYLCCYSWDKIVKAMRMSRESVFRLHRRSLENFSAIKIDTK